MFTTTLSGHHLLPEKRPRLHGAYIFLRAVVYKFSLGFPGFGYAPELPQLNTHQQNDNMLELWTEECFLNGVFQSGVCRVCSGSVRAEGIEIIEKDWCFQAFFVPLQEFTYTRAVPEVQGDEVLKSWDWKMWWIFGGYFLSLFPRKNKLKNCHRKIHHILHCKAGICHLELPRIGSILAKEFFCRNPRRGIRKTPFGTLEVEVVDIFWWAEDSKQEMWRRQGRRRHIWFCHLSAPSSHITFATISPRKGQYIRRQPHDSEKSLCP